VAGFCRAKGPKLWRGGRCGGLLFLDGLQHYRTGGARWHRRFLDPGSFEYSHRRGLPAQACQTRASESAGADQFGMAHWVEYRKFKEHGREFWLNHVGSISIPILEPESHLIGDIDDGDEWEHSRRPEKTREEGTFLTKNNDLTLPIRTIMSVR
jgi:hypothetical protein